MKIALNIEYFCPSKGGGETYAANFAKALVEKGHKVRSMVFRGDPKEAKLK